MTPKDRKNKLIGYADAAIRAEMLQKGMVDGTYDGQISAFSVAVALSGLKTAMAIYMDSDSGSAVDRKRIIRMLAIIYNLDQSPDRELTEASLWDMVKDVADDKELKKLILEYAIALKLTFRTFKYKDDGKKSS